MENSFKFIKNTFLQLTSKTYPFGSEDGLVEEMTAKGIFPHLEKDEWGNYFYKIGESKTIFASHLDTACGTQVDVKHQISKQQIVTTDGTSILGADDKAGVTILLWMMKNKIPGLYYFFIGEEVGCVGSSSAAPLGGFRGKYDRIISFDRRGTNSVITFQSSYRCCSDDFAEALAKQLNLKSNLYYKKDETGVYTDSAEFVDYIPECTNISVGYLSEHTVRESQDLYHLNKLALAVLDVEWEKLPTKRDASKKESKWDSYKWNSEWNSETKSWNTSSSSIDEDDDYSYGWGSKKKNYLEGYDYDDSTSRYRKTRRGKRNRTYFDNGNGKLTPFDNKKDAGVFDVLRDKFLASDLTKKELESVKNQYLDMTDPYDVKCFNDINQFL